MRLNTQQQFKDEEMTTEESDESKSKVIYFEITFQYFSI